MLKLKVDVMVSFLTVFLLIFFFFGSFFINSTLLKLIKENGPKSGAIEMVCTIYIYIHTHM